MSPPQRHHLRLVALWLILPAIALGRLSFGQDAQPGTVTADIVTVRTVAGESIVGRLASLGDRLTITTEDGETQELSRDAVISVTMPVKHQPLTDPDALVLLVNGDRLAGRTANVQDDSLTLMWDGTGAPTALTVPLEDVRSIVLSQPDEELDRSRLRRQWALEDLETDRVFFTNRTYTDGELSLIDDERLVMETTLGPVETPRAEISAVIMNSTLAAKSNRPEEYAILQTADGSRVTFESVTLDDGNILEGRSLFGTAVRIPTERVVSLLFFGRHVVSLADLEPLEYVFTPYLTEQHPLVKHRNVHGGRLRLRGVEYATGLGMHSKSVATYDLAGRGVSLFEATIGVDDMADGQGHVLFAVEVDGTRAFESGGVSGRSEPIRVGPIDVTDAERLSLIVEFGRLGNIRDIADWCDPLLINPHPVK